MDIQIIIVKAIQAQLIITVLLLDEFASYLECPVFGEFVFNNPIQVEYRCSCLYFHASFCV